MRRLIIVVAALGTAGLAGGADHADGGLPAAYALLAGDGRTLALGGAGVALDGFGPLYYNPAALATLTRDVIATSYRAMSFDRRILGAGYGRPILEGAGAGISWMNASAGDIEGRSAAGNPTADVSNSQNLFVFGFARPTVSWVQLGVAGRFYYSVIGTGKVSGFGLDAGVRVMPLEQLTLAAAGRDLATSLRWSHEEYGLRDVKEDVPTRGLLGAAYRPWKKLALVVQGDVGQGEDWRLRGGAEVWADERLALRAGYDDGAPTLGAAVVLPRGGVNVTFDYAFVEEDFTGEAAHTASLSLDF